MLNIRCAFGAILFATLSTAVVPAMASESPHALYMSELAAGKKAGFPLSIRDLYRAYRSPAKNAAVYYGQIKAYVQSSGEDEPELAAYRAVTDDNPTDDDWATAKEFLAANGKLVRLAHLAASTPGYAPAKQDNVSNPANVLFPLLKSMRGACRVITIESLVMAHDGKPVHAIQNQALNFRIAEHAQKDVSAVPWLVGVAVDAINLGGIERILRQSKGQMKVVVAVNQVMPLWHPKYAGSALKSEYACQRSMMEYLRRIGPERAAEFAEKTQTPFFGNPDNVGSNQWNTYLDSNAASFLTALRKISTIDHQPYDKAQPFIDETVSNASGDIYPYHTVSDAVLKTLSDLKARQDHLSARAAVIRAACAVFAYKSKHGDFPSSLADATPTAIDPFNGSPLGYRQEGDGFVVFSVGASGDYDGNVNSGDEHDEAFRYSADQ